MMLVRTIETSRVDGSPLFLIRVYRMIMGRFLMLLVQIQPAVSDYQQIKLSTFFEKYLHKLMLLVRRIGTSTRDGSTRTHLWM